MNKFINHGFKFNTIWESEMIDLTDEELKNLIKEKFWILINILLKAY